MRVSFSLCVRIAVGFVCLFLFFGAADVFFGVCVYLGVSLCVGVYLFSLCVSVILSVSVSLCVLVAATGNRVCVCA